MRTGTVSSTKYQNSVHALWDMYIRSKYLSSSTYHSRNLGQNVYRLCRHISQRQVLYDKIFCIYFPIGKGRYIHGPVKMYVNL